MLGFEETASIDQLVKSPNCGGKKIYTCCPRFSCWSKRHNNGDALAPTDTEKIHEGYSQDTARIQKRYTKDTERIQKIGVEGSEGIRKGHKGS